MGQYFAKSNKPIKTVSNDEHEFADTVFGRIKMKVSPEDRVREIQTAFGKIIVRGK